MVRRAASPMGPAWIDACPTMHGAWFDRGELDLVRAFVAEGGLSLPKPPTPKRGLPLLANERHGPPTGVWWLLFR
jgi:hypothetical protein